MPKTFEAYPLTFRPVMKVKPWGGSRLKKLLGKPVPRKTGETWEIAARGPAETSVIANGPLKGIPLTRALKTWPGQLMGPDLALRFSERFPLLVKFLDCDGQMSIQVHPPDEFAQRHEPEGVGKTEAWYVVAADPEAKIIRGVLPGTTAEEFRRLLQGDRAVDALNALDVKPGDVIFLPPGTVHTAGGGVVLLEVSQNSDVTYRVHDWNRPGADGKPRALHVDKALQVIDFYSMGVSKHKPIPMPGGHGAKRRLLLKCDKFTWESLEFRAGSVRGVSSPDRFYILNPLEGQGDFLYGSSKRPKKQPFKKGQTFFIPAALGDYKIRARGACKIIITYVER